MDLDDVELRATRMMNGADKESNIEDDIETINRIISFFKDLDIIYSNDECKEIKALNKILKENTELREKVKELDRYDQINMNELNKNYKSNRSIEEIISNLKRYIASDEIYTRYKNGEYTEISDFELFCINHCKDIEVVLGNLDALCDMQRTADRELENARQINEEHRKENGLLREKVKELESENKDYNIAYNLGKAFSNKKWEQKIKDKIKELSNTKGDFATYIAVSERIRALEEILQESENQ